MTEQDWTNIGGAEAFQLIERHAEDWADAGRMMEAWRDAQNARLNAEWMAKCEDLRKATIEECAKECDQLAVENEECMREEDDGRFGVYAKKYRKAAAAIRALSNKEEA